MLWRSFECISGLYNDRRWPLGGLVLARQVDPKGVDGKLEHKLSCQVRTTDGASLDSATKRVSSQCELRSLQKTASGRRSVPLSEFVLLTPT